MHNEKQSPEGKNKMTSQTKPSRFSKKILAAIVIIIIVTSSAAALAEYVIITQPSNPKLPSMSLTLVGADGQQKILTEKDIAALQSYTDKGGFKSSGGLIAATGTYTGVPITTLLNLVGGMTSDETLTVTASDGYSMVYTYNQVANAQDFTTYDPITGSEKSPTQPMKVVATYLINGSALISGDGPLRIGVLGPEGLLTEGHFWTKMVTKMEITSNVKDWTVTVKATTNLDMNRQSFTADLNHFGINFTDSSGNVWTGTALWRWVSWSNYNGGVSNDSLDKGYSVKVVSGDGSSATFSDAQVKSNDNIIVAAELNDAVLSDPYWPLTLVGSDVSSQNSIKNIIEMDITIKTSQATASPTATPTPTATSTASPTPTPTSAPNWNLVINGTAAVSMSASDFATQVTQSTATYTDSTTTWTGTPLHRLVVWAQSNGVISSALLTSGYVVKVIGSDGYVATFNDTRINMNTNIMVANNANGSVLTGTYAPLTLTGSDLVGKEKVKGIAQIQILPIQDFSITIVASNGTRVTLFSNDIAKLNTLTMNGGSKKSTGTIVNVGNYTGVTLLDLCNQVGGITSSNTITVKGSDGYTSSYTYAQVASGTGFPTYDSSGNTATPTQPLYLILAYWYNGTNIPTDSTNGGPLKTMIVGADGLITNGSSAAKLVIEIDIS